MSAIDDVKHDDAHIEEAVDADGHLSKAEFVRAHDAALLEAPKSPGEVLRSNWKVVSVILSVQTLGVILGLEYVLLGALVGVQAFCKTMGTFDPVGERYSVDAWKLSLWAGVFGIAQFLGQLIMGAFSDKFGRRLSIYTIIFLCYIGVMLEVVSPNYKVYTIAKVVMGLVTGGLQVAVPTYVAEVAPREIRGIMLGLFAFNLSFGALIGNLVCYGASTAFPLVTDNRGWKVALYVGLAAPTVTLVLCLFLLAESPYWLVIKGRVRDAEASFRKLYPHHSDAEIEDDTAVCIFTVNQEREKAANHQGATFMDCFRGVNLRRTFVAAFPSAAQQLAGNQLIQSYSTYFFTLAKISNSLRASSIVSALGLVGAIIAFFVIERRMIGRWWLVFVGMACVTIAMLGIGIVDSATHDNINTGAGWALVFFAGLYNLAVSVGPGVAGWAYAGEAGSARLRAKTTAFATGSNAIIGTFWNVVLPYELTAIGPKTGYMFFGIGLVSTIVIYFFIPDLTSRTYAQMDEMFEKKIPSRKFRTYECTGE